nr:7 alpha-hydroxy-4-cholesten-3-one 12 alpha-hydroxylase, cytochrome P450 12alpha, HCO 12alpha-hydroxylase {N-terminal} [rabbits, liver microsomes, Peptide Partial, 15 aa] [Oryctolagus cuniculus]
VLWGLLGALLMVMVG